LGVIFVYIGVFENNLKLQGEFPYMKKLLSLVLIALSVCTIALAEPIAQETVATEGVVLEIMEDSSYLIADTEGRKIQVLLTEATVLDVSRVIAVGDYLYVDYDGKMTRSIPAQITADAIHMYVLEGNISELYADENALLLNAEDGDYYVTLPESLCGQEITAERLTVYFNGAMTKSLPPQINAGYVQLGYAVQGAITELCEEYIVLGEANEAVHVQVNANTAQRPDNLKLGDVIRVIYDGTMTRSLPPQINADEIILVSR